MTTLLRLLGLLLIATAIAIALSRAPDRPVQTLVARWGMPPSDFVDVGGQIVHVRDVGPRDDPLPIVLVHGLSSSLHTWDGWAAALGARRRVISFDLPGFGLTGPNASGQYSTEADARFTLALLDHLRIARAVVGGSSLGGEVAWQLAALAPERVERLILVSATGPDFRSERVPLGWVLARVPVLRWLGESLLPRGLVAEGLVKAYADDAKVTPDLVDRYFEIALREGNRRALGQRLAQWTPGAHAARIAQVKAPTLVLWGAQDQVVPPAVAREFGRLIAGSRVVVFDHLGHVPHEEDPAATLEVVRDFLGLR